MNCPSCHESQAHRSHRAGLNDWLNGLASRTPYRCRSCKKRFYVYMHGEESSNLRTPEERRILKIRRKYKWRKSKRQLIAFVVFSILLVGVLYLLMQERIPVE
jgi:hypothetical protein